MHDNTVVMCVYLVKHPSLRQSRARLFTPLSVLAKTTRFSSLLFCRTKKPESVFIFSFPQTHSLVMFRILLRFWLAGGQRSIKSVWPVLVPLNIWHLHKPYIMPLSLRLPRFCMISLSFVGSIIHVQFGCSPSFFFFFFLSLRLCSVLLIAATTNMPIVEQPCCQLVGALFHPAVSIGFVFIQQFLLRQKRFLESRFRVIRSRSQFALRQQ